MRIVITGALGHIGSALLRSLTRDFPGVELLLVDNLSAQRYCSLFDLPADGRFRFVEADVLTADLPELFGGADAVVHLAAITNAAGSFENQAEVERVNFDGTERVARACLTTGARLLFVSTTSVYGAQVEVVDEDCPPQDLKPQSPYAESKLRAERLLADLGDDGLRFVTCRFGTIFGPSIGMRFHTAVNKFCWQAALGQPLTVWRSALHQRRPYLELGDATRAVAFLLRRDGFDCRVYNVLTINATVTQIVGAIRRVVPDVRVEEVDSRIMNQLSYTVSSKRFEALGFDFRGDLERAIEDTFRHLQGLRPDGPRLPPGARLVGG